MGRVCYLYKRLRVNYLVRFFAPASPPLSVSRAPETPVPRCFSRLAPRIDPGYFSVYQGISYRYLIDSPSWMPRDPPPPPSSRLSRRRALICPYGLFDGRPGLRRAHTASALALCCMYLLGPSLWGSHRILIAIQRTRLFYPRSPLDCSAVPSSSPILLPSGNFSSTTRRHLTD